MSIYVESEIQAYILNQVGDLTRDMHRCATAIMRDATEAVKALEQGRNPYSMRSSSQHDFEVASAKRAALLQAAGAVFPDRTAAEALFAQAVDLDERVWFTVREDAKTS